MTAESKPIATQFTVDSRVAALPFDILRDVMARRAQNPNMTDAELARATRAIIGSYKVEPIEAANQLSTAINNLLIHKVPKTTFDENLAQALDAITSIKGETVEEFMLHRIYPADQPPAAVAQIPAPKPAAPAPAAAQAPKPQNHHQVFTTEFENAVIKTLAPYIPVQAVGKMIDFIAAPNLLLTEMDEEMDEKTKKAVAQALPWIKSAIDQTLAHVPQNVKDEVTNPKVPQDQQSAETEKPTAVAEQAPAAQAAQTATKQDTTTGDSKYPGKPADMSNKKWKEWCVKNNLDPKTAVYSPQPAQASA